MSDAYNTNTASSMKSDNVLRPVSIGLLYVGMAVHDDIYDSSGSKMLMAAGNTITADNIERMRRLNNDSDIIYVTGRTHNAMSTKMPDISIDKRLEVENSTGYSAILTRTRELFNDISVKKKINRDGFCDVAGELSKNVKADPQEVTIALINAIAPLSDYMVRHILGVAMLNGLLGIWLGLSDARIDKLILIGLLHDCGHALMPPEILNASRLFTKIDYEVIKMHPIRTEQLLSDFPDDIRITAGSHHERIDGSGYPKGISGDTVTGAARITAISDIYEAIVAVRPYRKPNSPFYALDTLDTMAPSQLDNDVTGVIHENLPGNLTDLPVMMSDGTIGIVREHDPQDIKYPTVEVNGRVIKTSRALYCVSMYLE